MASKGMSRIWEYLARLLGLSRRTRGERELDDELRSHLELAIAENVRRGMTPAEARHAALVSLGGIEQTKEAWRDQRGLPWLENFAGDIRYGLRLAARNPGFALAAVLALALGIGANGAIFSVLDRALLRSLPYPDANRLVMVGMVVPSLDSRPFMFASSYLDFRDRQAPFTSMASWRPGVQGCDLTEARPVRLRCAWVESTFLPTFGVQPILGRNFTAQEDMPHAPNVVLISYGLWRSRFAGDPAVIGWVISLEGEPATIIGVLPKNFELPTLAPVDILTPEALPAVLPAERSARPGPVVRVYARLKPGVSIAQAYAELQPVAEQFRQSAPPMFRKEIRLAITPVREDQVGDVRQALWILFGAALALLLLGCANVANLLLARSASRQRELAVRAALGAGRPRLVTQRLNESLILGLAGGIVGCMVAFVLLRLFEVLAPAGIPRLGQAGLDGPVLLFVFCIAIVAGILCGLPPALATPSAQALASARSVGAGRGWFGPALVAVQVCVSLVLASGAGLLLETLRNIEIIPLGLSARHVVTVEISLGTETYRTDAQRTGFFDRLGTRLRTLPGVDAVAASDSLPPSGGMHARPFFVIHAEGQPPFEKGTGGMVAWRAVTPGYFRILGIPILEGRGFIESDRDPHANVVVLSRMLAARLFPHENPVGLHIQLDPPSGAWYAVVGVAANVKNSGLVEAAAPEYCLIQKSAPDFGLAGQLRPGDLSHGYFLVQSALPEAAVANEVRGAVAALDPTLPVSIEPFDLRIERLEVRPRFDAVLISLFAGLGVVLAALGLYGVLSFQVAGRRQEIGVRLALGAAPRAVLKMMVWRGLRVVIAGLVVGLGLALGATRLLGGLLYQVKADDPRILTVAVLVLFIVVLAACAIPARRAARIDPVAALRNE
jgi:putative ABC transport system permease protein